MPRTNLLDRLTAVLQRCGLTGSTLLVGVSGGPDSVALLLGLAKQRASLGLALYVAHFDHHLRNDSRSDAEFVRQLSHELGLPYLFGEADVRARARECHQGLEVAARGARYQFFAASVRSLGAAGVVVGHSADDQTETRLLHLIRGSGLRGLRGMTEDSLVHVPRAEPVRVIRPLLDVSRDEIERFCLENDVRPRRDSSNGDRTFRRNRIRHEVTPVLRGLNPRLDDALERLSRSAADAEEFVEAELDRRLPTMAEVGESVWTIDRKAWTELPRALKRALLRRAAAALGGSDDVGADAINSGMVAVDRWSSGRVLDWPGGRQLRIDHDWFEVGTGQRMATRLEPSPLSFDRDEVKEIGPLPESLLRSTGGWTGPWSSRAVLRSRRATRACESRRNDPWHADLALTRFESDPSLTIRGRQPGDWLMPVGMSGRKKLQDVLLDRHIPRHERDRVPILSTSLNVAWVVGLCHDRRFLAGPADPDVVCLEVGPPREGA